MTEEKQSREMAFWGTIYSVSGTAEVSTKLAQISWHPLWQGLPLLSYKRGNEAGGPASGFAHDVGLPVAQDVQC